MSMMNNMMHFMGNKQPANNQTQAAVPTQTEAKPAATPQNGNMMGQMFQMMQMMQKNGS